MAVGSDQMNTDKAFKEAVEKFERKWQAAEDIEEAYKMYEVRFGAGEADKAWAMELKGTTFFLLDASADILHAPKSVSWTIDIAEVAVKQDPSHWEDDKVEQDTQKKMEVFGEKMEDLGNVMGKKIVEYAVEERAKEVGELAKEAEEVASTFTAIGKKAKYLAKKASWLGGPWGILLVKLPLWVLDSAILLAYVRLYTKDSREFFKMYEAAHKIRTEATDELAEFITRSEAMGKSASPESLQTQFELETEDNMAERYLKRYFDEIHYYEDNEFTGVIAYRRKPPAYPNFDKKVYTREQALEKARRILALCPKVTQSL